MRCPPIQQGQSKQGQGLSTSWTRAAQITTAALFSQTFHKSSLSMRLHSSPSFTSPHLPSLNFNSNSPSSSHTQSEKSSKSSFKPESSIVFSHSSLLLPQGIDNWISSSSHSHCHG